MYCDNCKQEFLVYNLFHVEYNYLCENCVLDLAFKCENCGELFYKENGIEFEDDLYCESCLDDITGFCEQCNERFLEGDLNSVQDKYVCNDCLDEYYFRCTDCGKYFSNDMGYEIYNGNLVCEDCISDYPCCENCGEYFPEDRIYYSERDDCSYCESCRPNSVLNDASYLPRLKFNKSTKDIRTKLYFGAEIELEEGENEKLSDWISDFFFLKEDGSIKDGCETVTHPFTWNWFQENKNIFKKYFNKVENLGYREESNCGIHFHLSRKAFTTKRLLHFLKLFYENEEFITYVSGRIYNDSLRQWSSLHREHDMEFYAEEEPFYDDKYQAVNLSNNDTIEVRIFSSTTEFSEFEFKLEFVKAAYDFAGKTTPKKCKEQDFIKFLKKHKNSYPHLQRLREKIYA
jgi:formylmethanofuran dehydrogenase subunit E